MRWCCRSLILVFVASATVACGERQAARDETAAGRRGDSTVGGDVMQACGDVAAQFRRPGATRVDVQVDSFLAFTDPVKRFGCVVRAEGTLGGAVTIPFLAGALADSLGANWTRDSALAADGPRGTTYGIRRGSVLCLFRITWRMKVRYDPRGDPAPYVAEVGCERSGTP